MFQRTATGAIIYLKQIADGHLEFIQRRVNVNLPI